MEFASIEDAFPQDAFPQLEKSKEKRRHKKKEGFQAYELPPTDADRPAVKRMLEIPPINTLPNDQEDGYLDENSKQLKKATVNNSLPSPRTNFNQNSTMPSFFGAEPFSNPSEDSLAIYNSNAHKQSTYMLEADFTKSFEETGFGKSAGKMIPTPELRQRWKPLSADRVDTAFTNNSKNFEGLSSQDFLAMRSKLDTLIARLDDLENRAEGANPQLEMLSFIMTGLFLMFALDLTVKKLAR